MANKRITTVDEMLDIDPDADYLLVSRGVQQDLRRILLRRLPPSLDIHDDVADELTTLAGADRLVISDEGSPGAPQKFVKLSTLRSFFLDLFDLHDDVPVELTRAANEDRLLISDESEAGDPQKWISLENFGLSLPGMRYDKIATETEIPSGNTPARTLLDHTLGKVPIGFSVRLICKTADRGYSPKDEVILGVLDQSEANGTLYNRFLLTEATTTQVAFLVSSNMNIALAHKNGSNNSNIVKSRWRLGVTVWG